MAKRKRLKKLDVTVRRATTADAAALADVHAQPRAIWGTMQLPLPTVDDWRERLQRGPKDGMYPLVAVVNDRVVGNLTLILPLAMRRRHVASLGMAVHDDFHGRGVGSALMAAAIDLADRWLNIIRLELEVYVDNPHAIALYKKFGFEDEGTRRMFAFRDGQYVDVLMMARLRLPTP